MIKIKCSRKRYLISGVSSLIFLVVTLVCVLFITQRGNESNNLQADTLKTNGIVEIQGSQVIETLTIEPPHSGRVSNQPTLEDVAIPQNHITNIQDSEEKELTQSILRAILNPKIHIDIEQDNNDQEKNNSSLLTQILSDFSTHSSLDFSIQTSSVSETANFKTVCDEQEKDQTKRQREAEHTQLLRIRENEYELKEAEHGQLFDMRQKEIVLLEEEHSVKMKILLEKLLYYRRLNNNSISRENKDLL